MGIRRAGRELYPFAGRRGAIGGLYHPQAVPGLGAARRRLDPLLQSRRNLSEERAGRGDGRVTRVAGERLAAKATLLPSGARRGP